MNTDLLPLIIRFNDALNARDVDAMMDLLTTDCVFENTYPAPAGTRYTGQSAVREFWEDFFRGSSEARIRDRGTFRTERSRRDALDLPLD